MTSVRSVNYYVEDVYDSLRKRFIYVNNYCLIPWRFTKNGISKIKKGIYSWKHEILTESNHINILYLQYIAKNHAHAIWSTDATFVYGRYILTLIRA